MACLDVADLGGAGVESPQKGARSGVVGDAWRLAVIVTIAGALTRLVVAAFTPLFPDETYYWEFSRRLAGGYFDHPPVIAWLVRFGTLLFGDTSFGVRFGAVIAGAVAALFTAAAARRLRGPRGALIAAVVFALMPLSTGLTLATPDAPLLCFVAATLYALVRALEHEPHSRESLRWWCAAGVALGLAVASKYTAALVGLAVFVGMVAIPQLRARLREPGPYLGTGIALLVFSPVIAWNATHDWASFAFQLNHGLAPVGGSALRRELELLGGQAALVSPVLFVLLFVASFRALVSRTPAAQHPTRNARRLLAMVALLVFAFFIYSATKRRVEANWPALAYIAAIIVFATYAGSVRWRRWSRVAVTIAGFITGATFLNTITPILPVPARADPVARSAGWDEFAHVVQLELERRADTSRGIWVGTDRYQEASQLAFHLIGRPTTFAMNLTSRPNSYDYWPGFPQLARRGDALVLVLDQVGESQPAHPTVSLLHDHFTQVRRGDAFTVSRGGEPLRHVQIWILDGWRGTWPQAVVGSGS